jgi:hypothetical protein
MLRRGKLALAWIALAAAANAAQDAPPPVDGDRPVGGTEPAVDPAEAPARGKSRGLLGIADAESARATKAMRERILVSMRSYAVERETRADSGEAHLRAIVLLGPDAVPLLFDILADVASGSTDAAYAGPAARAICGIFLRTGNESILEELGKVVRAGGPAVSGGVLEGLESVDHAKVVEIAAPLLAAEDVGLQARAVRVLKHQKRSVEFVAGLLRPLLERQAGPFAEVLGALQDLEDDGGVSAAQSFLATSSDPALLAAAVSYLDRMGRKASLPSLRTFLLGEKTGVPDVVLKQAIDAVAGIGMEETDARNGAEEILVDVFRRHPDLGVRDWARWQLGPFQNEDALKSLEDPLLQTIAENRKAGRSNTDRFVRLAEYRLRFEAWSKAYDACKDAHAEDSKNLRTSYIESLRAVALCGQGKSSSAVEKILLGMSMEERGELLANFPVLKKMADDPKYRDLFPPSR